MQQQDQGCSTGLGKTPKGCDPSVYRCWGQCGGICRIAFWISRSAVIDHNSLLVCHVFRFDITGRKSREGRPRIMFVRDGKIRVIGECLAATGTSKPNQAAVSRFD